MPSNDNDSFATLLQIIGGIAIVVFAPFIWPFIIGGIVIMMVLYYFNHPSDH
jgi:hypothetical protein